MSRVESAKGGAVDGGIHYVIEIIIFDLLK